MDCHAGIACKKLNKKYKMIGVEAEPTHYKMMKEHITTNLGSMENINIIRSAVTDIDGKVYFTVGHPEE